MNETGTPYLGRMIKVEKRWIADEERCDGIDEGITADKEE
jgi:hypothetical protein